VLWLLILGFPVRRQLRVTAQLINVGDGYHIWSEGYDRELKDVFGIQKEIAESVARAFKLSLTPKEERAIELDPDYALAYAGLADCFAFLYMYADSSVTNRQQPETNSRLALPVRTGCRDTP
jgi:hypothetical protein